MGYKYYETRYEDYVMGTGNAGEYAYGNEVAFPFGHGLSYTSFDYSDMQVVYNAETDRFEVTVTVTNSGSMKGKETVQVYAQSPYTDYDKENKVEKAAVLHPGCRRLLPDRCHRRPQRCQQYLGCQGLHCGDHRRPYGC